MSFRSWGLASISKPNLQQSAWMILVLLLVSEAAADTDKSTAPRPLQCANSPPCKLACSNKACDSSSLAAWASRSKSSSSSVSLEKFAAATGSSNTAAAAIPSMKDVIKRATAVAEQQALAAASKLRAGQQYPAATAASSGDWDTAPANRWTSGFFPGVLWQLHALTGKASFSDLARKWQAGLADKQADWAYQHDLGFIYLPSFVHSYEVTKSPSDLRQALTAAEALAWAYNPATRSLRTFEGWQPPHATQGYKQVVIIDFMMNVPLLVWAAKHSEASNGNSPYRRYHDAAALTNMAVQHARQVAANHVRPDGSTFHIVEYNPETAAINSKYTYQGYADNSTWARGQSWAIAGFAILAQETGKKEFLGTATKLADKWLELLTKQGEYVPAWDFNYPFQASLNGPRDSSAAAVAALGLLHLSEALSSSGSRDCGAKYLCAAVNTLRALASPAYLAAPGGKFAAVLKHGTGNHPSNIQVDVGLIYGDYYFLKALQKCKSMNACITYTG